MPQEYSHRVAFEAGVGPSSVPPVPWPHPESDATRAEWLSGTHVDLKVVAQAVPDFLQCLLNHTHMCDKETRARGAST